MRVFKGVPYAAAPVGKLRFRPPAPAPSWSGSLEATTFGSAPIQPPPPANIPYRTYLGAEISEDCLYLNIWQPEAPGPHPVLVWIHGGGNIAGAASQGADGTPFAHSGVVCVTIGYRVGVFGFLELGKILGNGYRGSSVNGLRDQIAALRWIKGNIEKFGGDPNRMTVSGGSAGAKNLIALMASPLARGLFASAIVESGGQTIHDMCSAEHVAELFIQRLPSGGDASALATMPAGALNAAQLDLMKAYDRPFPFRSVIGTDVLPHAPLDALRNGWGSRQRLMIGTNRDEAIMFIDRHTTNAPISQHDLANINVEAARPIAHAYDYTFASLDPVHRRVRFVSAEEYVVLSHHVANAVRRLGEVWMYRFEQPATSGPFAGWAAHGSEAIYVWKAFDDPLMQMAFGTLTPEARHLGDEMHERWCAFIRGRAPDISGKAAWPLFDGSRQLVFADNQSQPGEVDRSEVAMWESAPLGIVGPGGCNAVGDAARHACVTAAPGILPA